MFPCSQWKKPNWSKWICPGKRGALAIVGYWQDPWSLCRSRFPGRNYSLWNLHWNCLFLKDCIPWKEAMLEQLLGYSSTWEGSTQKEFEKDFTTWEGLDTEAKEKWEGGRSSRDKMLWTNCNFHSQFPFTSSGREAIEVTGRKKWNWPWEDGEGRAKDVFISVFVSHHPTPLLLGIKLIFPHSSIFCLWWQLMSIFPCFLSETFHLFSALFLKRRWSEKVA